jgi:cob(I)alamin adenosyltransferase
MKPNIGSGDDGKTNLIGKRVWKDDLRVEINGNIDELNSLLGLANSKIKDPELNEVIEKIQKNLFLIGATIAYSSRNKITEDDVKWVEGMIRKFEGELEPLNKFIIPFGEESSIIHLCRTKCRQIERLVVKLSKKIKIEKEILSYLNRLSDLLFTSARLVNKRLGLKEKEMIFG